MGLPLIGCGAFWLLLAAASPYGNNVAVLCAGLSLVLAALIGVADYHKLWRQ